MVEDEQSTDVKRFEEQGSRSTCSTACATRNIIMQVGRRGCNQEWHNLGITHKKKTMLVSKQSWAWYIRMTPDSGQRRVLAYCQGLCYFLKEVQFVCAATEHDDYSHQVSLWPHQSMQIATCHCHMTWHDHDTVSGKPHLFSPMF